eukprot:271558-Amphidinium_carterae.1
MVLLSVPLGACCGNAKHMTKPGPTTCVKAESDLRNQAVKETKLPEHIVLELYCAGPGEPGGHYSPKPDLSFNSIAKQVRDAIELSGNYSATSACYR